MEVTIPEIESRKLLLEYTGANNYIYAIKQSIILNKSKSLTRSQADYILKNHKNIPKVAKKWVEIDDYFSESLMTNNFLKEKPKSIWVEKILSESPKAFHIWGKVLESQKIHSFI